MLWLKIRRFPERERAGSTPARGTTRTRQDNAMNRDDAPFEIHVHGDVKLRTDVGFDALQDALKPLWKYAGARSLADGAASLYEDEPGIRFDPQRHLLQMCWTLHGEDDFRHQLDDLCMNLNELSAAGSPPTSSSRCSARYTEKAGSPAPTSCCRPVC